MSQPELDFHHLQRLKQDEKRLITTSALQVYDRERMHSVTPGTEHVLSK